MEDWRIGRWETFSILPIFHRAVKRFPALRSSLFRAIISNLSFNPTSAPAAPRLVPPIPPKSAWTLE